MFCLFLKVGEREQKIIRSTYDAVRNGAVCTKFFFFASFFMISSRALKKRGNCIRSTRVSRYKQHVLSGVLTGIYKKGEMEKMAKIRLLFLYVTKLFAVNLVIFCVFCRAHVPDQ